VEQEEVQATHGSGAKLIREIKQKIRKRFSAEEKIRIVLEGFRKEIPVSDLCRRESVASCLYYSWLKDFTVKQCCFAAWKLARPSSKVIT